MSFSSAILIPPPTIPFILLFPHFGVLNFGSLLVYVLKFFRNSICLMLQVEQWPSKEVSTLIFKTSTYITSHGQRDFADVFEVKDLEIRIAFEIIQVGPIQPHKFLKVENLSWLQIERDGNLPLLALKMEEKGHKLWLVPETGKGKEMDLPLEAPEKNAAALTC